MVRFGNIRFIALMMEAARTSETLVNFYQTTRCYNPEDSNLHTLYVLCRTRSVATLTCMLFLVTLA
jgi:hypothetical protein